MFHPYLANDDYFGQSSLCVKFLEKIFNDKRNVILHKTGKYRIVLSCQWDSSFLLIKKNATQKETIISID